MTASLCLDVPHDSHIGHVRRLVHETAERLGADSARAGAAAIVATELATNLVRHAGGGEILIREARQETGDGHFLEIHALDSGPGMASVAECLRDGYSTAGSAGTGLGAVRRLSDQFQIYSTPGQGTAVWVRVTLHPACPAGGLHHAAASVSGEYPVEYGGICVALRGEQVCGDAWDLRLTPEGFRLLVADGLGHGPFAGAASREAVTVFQQQSRPPHPHAHAGPGTAAAYSPPFSKLPGPSVTLQFIHEALMKTRGAAVSAVEADLKARRLTSAGVGNVSVRLIGPSSQKSLPADNGTLGANVRRITETPQIWEPPSLLILHSDGIASQWNLADYPGLAARHPALITGVLFRDFRRRHDDATIVAVRLSSRSAAAALACPL